MSSGPVPTSGGFVHPLLRARDWQDRPEFQALCQWWKDGGGGVCALVGIGGAGKTAIAERFLQILPGGYPEHPRVPKDRNLAAPARLFVFSFYDAPNPDTFFTELAAWLEGHPSVSRGKDQGGITRPFSYYQVLEFLAAAGKCLLVFDGLEKVQDDNSRGGVFGQILDGRLRDFVLRVADGHLPRLSLVITSRFRLYDPLVSRTWYYHQIEIEKLQPHTAVKLLRDRGVHGTDDQLVDIARKQGFHALSVDLVGGYIARFCGSDPKRFTSLATEQAEVAGPTLDTRVAAIREQESKSAHVVERYHKTLAQSDPAALALLHRICLFRLGVEAKTLSSVFTGKKKENISGSDLAGLNEQQLQSKLQLLVEMRLVEASKIQSSVQQFEVYTVHPAVRDGFLKKLDTETARLGHDAAREGLMTTLQSLPGEYPSDPATLDLMEEIVYHTLAAGHTQEAWDIYWYQMGGYENLFWNLGNYERGERICRAFAPGQSSQIAPLPPGLTEVDQAIFINEWGLYLGSLGQLSAAVHCHERHNEFMMRQEDWTNFCTGKLNVAELLLLAGRLIEGLSAVKDMLRVVDLTDDQRWVGSLALSSRAHLSALCGNLQTALTDFRDALKRQNKDLSAPLSLLPGRRGTWNGLFLMRLGRIEQAFYMADANRIRLWGKRSVDVAACNLLLADLARERGDLSISRELLYESHDWALQHDAKELLCWSALVRAKIELSSFDGKQLVNQEEARAILARATSALEDGLHIARDCGFGIYHIDLLLVRAQLTLYEGRAFDVEQDVHLALDKGVHPPQESGFPELLAATDLECLYAWGIAEGRHLLAEALLLQAAQKLGRAEFAPKRFDHLPTDVRDLIGRAHEQLDQALELWHKLRDPESDGDINPRGERTKRVLQELEGGILTEYPLEPVGPEEPTVSTEALEVNRKVRPMPKKKHIFLSYCHDNKAEVTQLHDDLVAAGEAVWWDQVLLPGQDWEFEIRQALEDAYAVIICFSKETAARTTSGMYPEAADAIEAYRKYSPGSVYLIPVRLSDCEIPPIKIDGTRTLKAIQAVDLFPPAQRATGLDRLLKALKTAPHHP